MPKAEAMHATALASLPGCVGFWGTANRWCRSAQPPATPSDASGIHRPASAPNQVAAPSRRCAKPPLCRPRALTRRWRCLVPGAPGQGTRPTASFYYLPPSGDAHRTRAPHASRRDVRMVPVVERSDTTGTHRPPHDTHPGRGARTRRKRSRQDARDAREPPAQATPQMFWREPFQRVVVSPQHVTLP